MKLNTFDKVPEIGKQFVIYWRRGNEWLAEHILHAHRKGCCLESFVVDVTASPDLVFEDYMHQIESDQIAWLSNSWIKCDGLSFINVERHKELNNRWVYCSDVIQALKSGTMADYRRLEVTL